MKYVFVLVLLLVATAAGLQGLAIVTRWTDNMTETPKVVPGERNFVMPTGLVPFHGELVYPADKRDLAAKQPNPIRPTPESIAIGKARFQVLCTPCHGPEGKGGITGLVATKFIPTPNLTDPELQKQRTDGYWHSYITAGGAVMPAYGETVSSQEAWDIVNFLRSIAAR